ncbi:MAG: serine/threonine-protein kinase, partial [Planctomycetota bacterium]|nr:serine/threonine-protein kinase [Planctomycetota bacterium]
MTNSLEKNQSEQFKLSQPGQFIDGYQIVEVLGHGGMGAVYRVQREHREYALKVMLKETIDLLDLAHFEREAQATAAIKHPNVVAVHSLKLNSDTPYILFDYVRGQSLDRFIEQPWTLEQLIPFLLPVAEALDYIHQQGLIHRDLKPANIMVREHDRCPLLADFGLARGGSLESLTQTGMVKGTPSFMAPEQLQGLEVGPGVDLWAFAVMSYQLLTGGTLPFTGDNPIALASAVLLKEAPSISEQQEGLPEAL